MKIITWNVNGIRAWLKKDGWKWVAKQKADVICLQEVRALEEQMSAKELALFDGYHACWHPAEKKGYSGVLTLSKEEVEQRLGFGIEEYSVEGRVIETRFPDYWLYNIYFPNGGRDQERLDFKLAFYADLLKYLKKHKKPAIITGDFNTSHQNIDLTNHAANKNHSGFMPIEREWITKYIDAGYVDAFRLLYPDKVQYTWWAQWGGARERNVGWRLDYYLVSEPLMPRIKMVKIHDKTLGSDHCPVTMEID